MDMREFDLPGRQFGLVIIAANSLLHLHDPHDIRRRFVAIARHLLPGGALAFDVFVASVHILAREPNQRNFVGRFIHGMQETHAPQQTPLSLDHLVGADDHRMRQGKADAPCGLLIDVELKSVHLFHRNLGGISTLRIRSTYEPARAQVPWLSKP